VKTIALDAMSGDTGVAIVIPAAIAAINDDPSLRLVLVGDEPTIRHALNDKLPERISVVHTTEVVGMAESPSAALRFKKNSSMRVAINLVKDGKADACVSAGNTGALMATARFVLKTIPGIDRPAIVSSLPTTAAPTRLLDLGANVEASPEHLLQFAIMGSALVSGITAKQQPSVALLNIGSEEIKGNDTVKQAALKLAACESINFVGYIEGNDIFAGIADVVVCDGFVGNVALKSIEGVASLLTHALNESFCASWYGRFVALLAYPIIRKLGKRLDPSRYNGASLLGLNGIVVKSHGASDVLGFRHAILEACQEVEHRVPTLIKSKMAAMQNGDSEE
jgi:phosphate acyltransferase